MTSEVCIGARPLLELPYAGVAEGADHKGPRHCRSWDTRWQARTHASQCAPCACGACALRVRRGFHGRTLGAAGSATAGAGRRGGGERWRAAAAGMAHREAPDM